MQSLNKSNYGRKFFHYLKGHHLFTEDQPESKCLILQFMPHLVVVGHYNYVCLNWQSPAIFADVGTSYIAQVGPIMTVFSVGSWLLFQCMIVLAPSFSMLQSEPNFYPF